MSVTGNSDNIEDILASIRKIIADEPAQNAAASPAVTAQSATQQSIPVPSGRDTLPSAMTPAGTASPAPAQGARAEPFFRWPAGSPPPAAPAADTVRARAAAIDDDLADLIDTPDKPASATPEPAPGLASREASPPVEAARQKWAELLDPPPASSAKPASVSHSSGPAAAASAPSVLVPRAGGFYPPHTPSPATGSEPSPAAKAIAAAPQPAIAPVLVQAAEQSPKPSLPAEPLAPKLNSMAADNPSAAAAAALDALAAGLAAVQPDVAPAAPAPVATASAPVNLVAAALANLGQPAAGESAVSPVTEQPAADKPAAAPQAIRPAVEATPAPTASVRPMPAPQTAAPAPVAPAPVAKAAVAPAPGPAARPVAAAPAPLAPEATPAPRTLEDTVSDMLRPLLEKWLAENMPKIVERALKLDAASPTGKTGGNGSST